MSDLPVLIVEDEMLIAMSMADELADAGHATIIASSIAQAVEELDRNAFKLAIVDFNINGYSSLPVIEQLVRAGIPFIVCTGSQVEDVASIVGEVARLPKPYAAEHLLAAVNQALELGRQH